MKKYMGVRVEESVDLKVQEYVLRQKLSGVRISKNSFVEDAIIEKFERLKQENK